MLFALALLTPINAGSNPFAFFQPTVVLSPVDRELLENGTPIVHFCRRPATKSALSPLLRSPLP